MSSSRERIRSKRVRSVTVDGVDFTFRKPEIRRILNRIAMYPGAITAGREAEVFKQEDADLKVVEANNADFFGLCCACICDACMEPKIAMTRAEADADESGETIWIRELLGTEEDPDYSTLNILAKPVFELLKITVQEARQIAPFREPGNADEAGAELGDEAGGTDGRPVVAGL